jgi:hypothetical protein
MSKPVDRTRFLSEPTRLAIAELCLGRTLTLGEIAHKLGREPGSLSGPETMADHGALKRRKRRAASQGRREATSYAFNPAWRAALDAARAARERRRWTPGRDLLVISLADTPAACATIAAGVEGIEWGARLKGEVSGLALAPEADPDDAATLRLIDALGVQRPITRLHFSEVMGPRDLRDWASRIRGGRNPVGQLPAES